MTESERQASVRPIAVEVNIRIADALTTVCEKEKITPDEVVAAAVLHFLEEYDYAPMRQRLYAIECGDEICELRATALEAKDASGANEGPAAS